MERSVIIPQYKLHWVTIHSREAPARNGGGAAPVHSGAGAGAGAGADAGARAGAGAGTKVNNADDEAKADLEERVKQYAASKTKVMCR